jgi:hypothetical protein
MMMQWEQSLLDELNKMNEIREIRIRKIKELENDIVKDSNR